MRRICTLLLAAAMLAALAGCAGQPQAAPTAAATPTAGPPVTAAVTPEATAAAESEPFLELADYPRVDGSTANLPLMKEVLHRVTGMDRAEAEASVSCSTTPWAYAALVEGNADLLLVYNPAEETRRMIDESGVELEFIPIGRDALVFIVNEVNAVESLTTAQLVDIYSGKTANWSQVGGADREIMAFQRPSASGSQALFMKLLMKDTAPMEAPTRMMPEEMGDLIEVLAEYNNDGGAIGYSVFYYASYMYTKPGLKFIAVDGVFPSDETIADASYPFLNEFYAVIRADEPDDSPARRIARWLTTPEGVECISYAGYIPVN